MCGWQKSESYQGCYFRFVTVDLAGSAILIREQLLS